MYEGLNFREVELRYTFNMAQAAQKQRRKEVIIVNF